MAYVNLKEIEPREFYEIFPTEKAKKLEELETTGGGAGGAAEDEGFVLAEVEM